MLNLMTLFQPMKTLYARYVLPVLAAYGVTRTELDILLFLANNPQYDTARDIIEVRRITKSHASISLKSMMESGYLRGDYNEGNRKVVHLSLLPAAMPVVRAGQAQRKIPGRLPMQSNWMRPETILRHIISLQQILTFPILRVGVPLEPSVQNRMHRRTPRSLTRTMRLVVPSMAMDTP